MFLLRKWYFDVVTDDGAVVIAYAARLRWGAAHLRYASVLRSPTSGCAVEDSRFGGGWRRPRVEHDTVTWRDESLEIDGRWERHSPPITHLLLHSRDGVVAWSCNAPAARAVVRHHNDTMHGIGYAESLIMTMRPWTLPFHELHWGRHASDRHAVVWIAWPGMQGARYVWFDGRRQNGASLADAGIAGLAGDGEVIVDQARDICRRTPLRPIIERLPSMLAPFVRRLNGLVDHKRVGRSSVLVGGQPVDAGWCVFEDVSW